MAWAGLSRGLSLRQTRLRASNYPSGGSLCERQRQAFPHSNPKPSGDQESYANGRKLYRGHLYADGG